MIAVTFDGQAPDIWYVDQAILFDYRILGVDTRLAADESIGDDRVAFVTARQCRPSEDVPMSPSPRCRRGAPVDIGQQATVPTPVRVDSIPKPITPIEAGRSRHRQLDLPAAVLVGLVALMAIGTSESSTTASRRSRRVDTSRPAS
jgi:hypothetical protein